jgi:hypothetical protein
MDQHSAEDDRSDGVECELEAGGDAEVSTATAESPEQLRALALGHRDK